MYGMDHDRPRVNPSFAAHFHPFMFQRITLRAHRLWQPSIFATRGTLLQTQLIIVASVPELLVIEGGNRSWKVNFFWHL